MNIKKKNILIILIIIIALIIGFLGYMIVNKHKKNNNQIDLTADEIIDLLTYVPYTVVLTNNYDNAYHGELVTNKDMLPLILLPLFVDQFAKRYENTDPIFQKKYNTESGSIYSIKDINNYLLNRYNIRLDKVPGITPNIKISKLDNKYVTISHSEISNFSFSFVFKIVLHIGEIYNDNSSIVIPEIALFYILKDDKYYVYKNTDINNQENILKIYNKIDEFGNELSYNDISEKIKEDFQDYNYVFKHTFKKNRYGYYYYSTEMIKVK